MASIYLEVTYVDTEPVVVRVGPKAQVLYERHFGESFYGYTDDPRSEKLYFMAWQSLVVAGKEPPEFDDFLDTIDEVTVKKDTIDDPVGDRAVNPEQDPTKQAQPSGTSSS